MIDLLYLLNKIFRLDVDNSGLTALVRLSNGDMRKALNILQVASCCFIKEELISFPKSLFLEMLIFE